MNCTNCGNETELGAFHCGACGAPIRSTVPVTTDLPDHAACALAYSLWALSGVLFLAIEPYNKSANVRFHAYQSIFLSLGIFAGWFVVLMAVFIFGLIPIIGRHLANATLDAFGLGILALWIVMMLRAYQGSKLRLPFVGFLAEKQS